MLKKVENIPISIRFQVIDSDNYMDLSFLWHSLFKEVEIQIAKQLKINPFKIQLTFQHPNIAGILNPSSTIYQNRIKNGDTIYVKVLNIQTRSLANNLKQKGQSDQNNMTLLDIVSGRPVKIDCVAKGLNLSISCTNKRCFNFSKNSIIQLGLGSFDYISIMNSIKCPVCPDKQNQLPRRLIMFRKLSFISLYFIYQRDLHTNPVCLVKEFIFKECLWSLEGYIIKNRVLVQHKVNEWIIVKSQDSTSFNQIISQNNWSKVQIIVKEIGRPKQKVPLLL